MSWTLEYVAKVHTGVVVFVVLHYMDLFAQYYMKVNILKTKWHEFVIICLLIVWNNVPRQNKKPMYVGMRLVNEQKTFNNATNKR